MYEKKTVSRLRWRSTIEKVDIEIEIYTFYFSPLTFWVWIPFRRGVLDTTLCDKVCQWNIVESGIKHHKLKHRPIFYLHSYLTFLFSVGKKWSCEKDVGDSQRKEFTGKSTVHI
jgi:hypothetical protein